MRLGCPGIRLTMCATALAALSGSAAAAAAQAPVALTLDEAVARAVAQAPGMAEHRAREAAARATYDARRAEARPSVSLAAGYTRTNHVDEVVIPLPGGGTRVLFPDIPDNSRVRGELVVPVSAFGRVGATLSAARTEVDAAVADRAAESADVAFETTRAYWRLVMARDVATVLEQALARTEAHLADVRARVNAGVAPPHDVLSAEVERARQEVRLIEARSEASAAEWDLARLIGAPIGTGLRPTTPVAAPVPAAVALEGLSLDDLLSRAIARRPDGQALVARRDGLRFSAQAALASRRPYLTAVATIEPARPNLRFIPPTDTWRTSWSLGAGLTWPLWDGGRSRAEAAALAAQADAVDARRRGFDELVALDLRQRLLDLDTGRAAIRASAEAVAAAVEAYRVVEARYRAGVATSTEVFDAQVARVEAELERTRLNARQRVGEAGLIRAAGGR